METQRMIKLHKFEYELYIIDFLKSVLNILSEIVLCINGCLLILFLNFVCFVFRRLHNDVFSQI